jgi:hypothetical protein
MSLGIVQTQRHAFDVARWAFRRKFIEIRAAVPDLSSGNRALKIGPGIGAREWMQPASEMQFPSSNLEVKIMLAVPFRGCRAGILRLFTIVGSVCVCAGENPVSVEGRSHSAQCAANPQAQEKYSAGIS